MALMLEPAGMLFQHLHCGPVAPRSFFDERC